MHPVVGSQASDESPLSKQIHRRWVLIEQQISVVPGIHVHLGHHASWQVSGHYVAVCQIDNLITQFDQKRKDVVLEVTKIQGLLEWTDGASDSSNYDKFTPVELMSLSPDLTDNISVPFGRSVQLVYTCSPFGSLPFKGWNHLPSFHSSSAPNPLMRIFSVVRSVFMARQIQHRIGKKQPMHK